MEFQIIITQKAIFEADDAFKFYEKRQVGLGVRFKNQLNFSISLVARHPKINKIIFENVRQMLVSKFPFVIVYEIIENKIIVYSIFHTSRNPIKKLKNDL